MQTGVRTHFKLNSRNKKFRENAESTAGDWSALDNGCVLGSEVQDLFGGVGWWHKIADSLLGGYYELR